AHCFWSCRSSRHALRGDPEVPQIRQISWVKAHRADQTRLQTSTQRTKRYERGPGGTNPTDCGSAGQGSGEDTSLMAQSPTAFRTTNSEASSPRWQASATDES